MPRFRLKLVGPSPRRFGIDEFQHNAARAQPRMSWLIGSVTRKPMPGWSAIMTAATRYTAARMAQTGRKDPGRLKPKAIPATTRTLPSMTTTKASGAPIWATAATQP